LNLPANSSNPGSNVAPERSAVWFDRGIDMKRRFPFALHLRKGRTFSPDLVVRSVSRFTGCPTPKESPLRPSLPDPDLAASPPEPQNRNRGKTLLQEKNRRCEMQNGQKEDEDDNF